MKLHIIILILPCTILAGKITFHTVNYSSVLISILPAFDKSEAVSKNFRKNFQEYN